MLKSTIGMADPFVMWWAAIAIVVLVVGITATVHFARNGHAARTRDARRATALLDEALECDDPERRSSLLSQAATALLRVKASDNTPASRFERQRDATFVLGFVRFEQERYVEAIDLLQSALQQPLTKATRARGLSWLAIAAFQCGDEALAESTFNALLKVRAAPASRRDYRLSRANHMAILAARRGAFADADGHLREARSFTRFSADPLSLRARAEVEFCRRNLDEAARLIAEAVEDNEPRGWQRATRQAECWALGARIQIARKELTLARAALEQGQALAPVSAGIVRTELLLVEATLDHLENQPSTALERAAALLHENPNPLLAARVAAVAARRAHAVEGSASTGVDAVDGLRRVGESLAADDLARTLGLTSSSETADRWS